MDLFSASKEYSSLSLKDLIQARDLFHYHLMNKKNVIATALGLYRIRSKDPWPHKEAPHGDTSRKQKPRRTLFNSEIRSYSWPCVYVFVSKWEDEADLANTNPGDVVPKALFLPDGRSVPVCVIEARRQEYSYDLDVDTRKIAPRNLLAPGSAIINGDAQGLKKIATAGCVVKDGDAYYVLTNRHVVGEPGTRISALKRYSELEIGAAAKKGLTRQLFDEVYPNFQSHHQYLLMDTGLVRIEDIRQWKTDVHGLSPICEVLDLYDNSFSLRLVGMSVVGESAVSGRVRGEIQGLFYRYKAQGGYEYLTDFLIGPETPKHSSRQQKQEPRGKNIGLQIHHGDSGTVLFIEHSEIDDDHPRRRKPPVYYPFGILWGKHEFIESSKRVSQPYALATALSTVLQKLNLDYVRDLNLDNDYVWGYVGHYVIGSLLPFSIDLLNASKLKSFIDKNYHLLTLDADSIVGNDPKVIAKDEDGNYVVHSPNFVPLADVPDNVWKGNVNIYMVEGADEKKVRHPGPGSRGSADNPNHFADVDLPYEGFDTFLEFNLNNPKANLDPKVWVTFYESKEDQYKAWSEALGQPFTKYKHWGALPFRVGQLFELMVKYAGDGNQDGFLAAGGVLIHYIGDACQPLHTSYLSQGNPDDLIDKPRADGKKMRADGVHSGYEDDMVEYGYSDPSVDFMKQLKKAIQDQQGSESIDAIKTGFDAALAVLKLVASTRKDLLPNDIVAKWTELKDAGTAKSKCKEEMWLAFGEQTISCMARGCRYLAAIWQAAWTRGGGNSNIGVGSERDPKDIQAFYENPKNLPSLRLDRY